MHDEDEKECVNPNTALTCETKRPTIMVELQNRRDKTAKHLEDIDAAIKLFTEQPALEQALTSIGRLNIRL